MYLGLDCGTSGLKALLTDEGGEPIASAARTYSTRTLKREFNRT